MYIHRLKCDTEACAVRLLSDLHIGSPNADYKAIGRAVDGEYDYLAINGDVFDLILPSDKKRYRPSALHKRLWGKDDVINAAVEWGKEILGPVAKKIIFIGTGNHESAAEKHHSIDPVRMLCDALGVTYGGYNGFVDFRLGRTGHGDRSVLYYHHGAGGGSARASAVQEAEKKLSFVECDWVWLGHRHHSIAFDAVRLRCPKSGHTPARRRMRLVTTGSFLKSYGAGQPCYAEERGLPPQWHEGWVDVEINTMRALS